MGYRIPDTNPNKCKNEEFTKSAKEVNFLRHDNCACQNPTFSPNNSQSLTYLMTAFNTAL